jgi:hypothetical protein
MKNDMKETTKQAIAKSSSGDKANDALMARKGFPDETRHYPQYMPTRPKTNKVNNKERNIFIKLIL